MSIKTKLLAAAATATLLSGVGVALSGAAQASTQTCNACTHVQNSYAFRGALDAKGAGTVINTPIILWQEKASTTDSGADLLVVGAGTVTHNGSVNQSSLNWKAYAGDSVARFKYDPYGNGGANTYVGLNGTKLALRGDNSNSIWQEFIEVPVSSSGVPETNGATACASHCVLIDVGQTANPDDPMVVTDPQDAFTGSGVQQDVEFASVNQAGDYVTNQVWGFQN